jgi:hypothetical protein
MTGNMIGEKLPLSQHELIGARLQPDMQIALW